MKSKGYWESGLKNILEEAAHKSRTNRQMLLVGQRPECCQGFSELKENWGLNILLIALKSWISWFPIGFFTGRMGVLQELDVGLRFPCQGGLEL